MSSPLEMLLELQELVVLRTSLETVGAANSGFTLDALEQKILKLRRKIPGRWLSEYDNLARQHLDAIVPVSHGVCQGCRGEISPQLVRRLEQSHEPPRCERCGRVLCAEQHTPAYLPVGTPPPR